MKIHDRGFGPIGQPDRSNDPVRPAAKNNPDSRFPAAPIANASPPIQPAGAARADLDNPVRLEALLRTSISQTLDAIPFAAELTGGQRQRLEAHMAADPAMRGLLIRYLDGTLR